MITNIRLQNFRSYLDNSFEFSNGVNIIVGPNATGKTNLIEAIYLVARNNSFRVKDIDLITFDADWSRVDSYISDTERTVKLVKENDRASKTTVIDSKEYKRLPKDKYYPVVLFEPSQLNILSGGPEGRRNLIDELISQKEVSYITTLNRYKRTLAQRNALLKSNITDKSQIFVWNTRLMELASEIVGQRLSLIEEINKSISDTYSEVAGKKYLIELSYETQIKTDNYAQNLFNILEVNLDKDILRGFTSYGPHRDDIKISINHNDSSTAASRGEARTMLLAIKTFEIVNLLKNYEQKPILLLDDVFSELDGLRRKKLTSFLESYQSFITTTDADVIQSNIKSSEIITTS